MGQDRAGGLGALSVDQGQFKLHDMILITSIMGIRSSLVIC